MDIILERAGRFNASRTMIPTRHKCGAMTSKIYVYEVRIEATDRTLTPEGYVLNNELVQVYFDNKFGKGAQKWEGISCENMARIAADDLGKLICNQGVDCRCVEVRIKGSNGAWITAKWSYDVKASQSN